MQQRQLRLGDILDDYCPRERRLTNHVVVAMIGDEIRQTRCTTCEAEHAYKHARVPRQRRKSEEPAALYSQVLADGPKRVTHEPSAASEGAGAPEASEQSTTDSSGPLTAQESEIAAPEGREDQDESDLGEAREAEDGPVHRPLIRATLPRHEGQAPPARPAPDFTIRQPGGRQNRFRPRNQRGGQLFQGNRSNGSMGGGVGRGGASRQNGGRPPQGAMTSRPTRRPDAGRKRSK